MKNPHCSKYFHLLIILILLPLQSFADNNAAIDSSTAKYRAEQWVAMLNNQLPIEQLTRDNFSKRFNDRSPPARIKMIFSLFKDFYKNKPAILEEVEQNQNAVIVRLSNFENKWAEYELMYELNDDKLMLGGFNAKILGYRAKDDWKGLTETALLSKTKLLLSELHKTKDFSGSVLIAKNNQVILDQNFGYADLEESNKIVSDTPFPIASVTKSITALAVAILVADKKLDLDATIGHYLPNLPNEQIRFKVTPRQLLMHTSGMESILFIDDQAKVAKDASLQETVLEIAGRALVDDPGVNFRYSNGGPFILAMLIEKISGISYECFIKKYIFKIANMTNSGFLYHGNYPNKVAVGSFDDHDSNHMQSSKELFDYPLMPGGSMYSSASDMLKLSNGLFHTKLFGDSVVEILSSSKVKMSKNRDYQLGLMERIYDGNSVLGHTGDLPGISAQWWHLGSSGYDLIVLSNKQSFAADIADRLLVALSSSQSE